MRLFATDFNGKTQVFGETLRRQIAQTFVPNQLPTSKYVSYHHFASPSPYISILHMNIDKDLRTTDRNRLTHIPMTRPLLIALGPLSSNNAHICLYILASRAISQTQVHRPTYTHTHTLYVIITSNLDLSLYPPGQKRSLLDQSARRNSSLRALGILSIRIVRRSSRYARHTHTHT